MSLDVNHVLHRVVGGTGILLVGAAASMLLGLASRVLIARHFTQSDYGVYALALTAVNIAVAVSTLGFGQGLARQVAYYRGRSESDPARLVTGSGLMISLLAAVTFSVVLFIAADAISLGLLHEPRLAPALRMVSLAIPFMLLLTVVGAAFRGMGRVAPLVYFRDIARPAVFPLLVGILILLGLPFSHVFVAFSVSAASAGVAFLLYARARLPVSRPTLHHGTQVTRELLHFSLPLLVMTILGLVIHWTDFLMLGYFKDATSVGLYNGAAPVARLIMTLLSATGLVYVPMASQLVGRGKLQEVRRTYQVLAKWTFSLTLPFVSVLVLFPETVLGFLFGPRYAGAATALQILSAGFAFHTFLGLNGSTLVTLGKPRVPMYASIAAAALNVGLNFVLIPRWGIVGAALASFTSYTVANAVNSGLLYRLSGIHPFTANYLRPLGSCAALIGIIYLVTRSVTVMSWWLLPPILLLFLGAYGVSLLLTRSLDREDIRLLLTIESVLGVDLGRVKRIVSRFL